VTEIQKFTIVTKLVYKFSNFQSHTSFSCMFLSLDIIEMLKIKKTWNVLTHLFWMNLNTSRVQKWCSLW